MINYPIILSPIQIVAAIGLAALSSLSAAFFVRTETNEYRFFSPLALILSIIASIFFYQLLTALNPQPSFIQASYLLFGWALATVLHSDAQTLLISRWTSLFLVPFAWIGANLNLLLITPLESIVGALLGLLTLALTGYLAQRFTGKESLGQGDVDFLACIGAFLGPTGCWNSLLIGSVSGSLLSLILLMMHGKQIRSVHLPLGTFLAIGAMIQLIAQLTGTSLFSF